MPRKRREKKPERNTARQYPLQDDFEQAAAAQSLTMRMSVPTPHPRPRVDYRPRRLRKMSDGELAGAWNLENSRRRVLPQIHPEHVRAGNNLAAIEEESARRGLALPYPRFLFPGRKQKPTKQTPIAVNIDRLRKDCGWSMDQLAEKIDHDKRLVLAHVHGKTKPRPSTVKVYADVFTKALGRKITPRTLEELR
jgi:hypothetical protein